MTTELTPEQRKGLELKNAVYAIVVREKNRKRKAISPDAIYAEAMREVGLA